MSSLLVQKQCLRIRIMLCAPVLLQSTKLALFPSPTKTHTQTASPVMLTVKPHKSQSNAAISPPQHRLATKEISYDSVSLWFDGFCQCALYELSQGLLHVKALAR